MLVMASSSDSSRSGLVWGGMPAQQKSTTSNSPFGVSMPSAAMMTPVTRIALRIRSPTRRIRPDSSSSMIESLGEWNFESGGGGGIERYMYQTELEWKERK